MVLPLMLIHDLPRAAAPHTQSDTPPVPPIWRLVTRRGSAIVPLNEHGTGPAFYCVHSISGEVSSLFNLVRALGPDQVFHGLQVPRNNMNAAFAPSVEAVARTHVQAIARFQPEGPIVLGGWSAGAIVALEMARQLRAMGRDVPLLVALDGAPCNTDAGLRRWDPRYLLKLVANLPGWFHHHVACAASPAAFGREIAEKIAFRVRTVLPKLKSDQPLDHGAVEGLLNNPGFAAGQRAFIRAMYDAIRAYVPRPYDGDVLVYEARTQPLDHLMQIGATWRKIARNVEIVPLAGIHDRLLRRPALDDLSRDLGQRLAILRRRYEAR